MRITKAWTHHNLNKDAAPYPQDNAGNDQASGLLRTRRSWHPEQLKKMSYHEVPGTESTYLQILLIQIFSWMTTLSEKLMRGENTAELPWVLGHKTSFT